MLQPILFIFLCRFRFHQTLEAFASDGLKLGGSRIQLLDNFPSLFVHQSTPTTSCLGAAALKILMGTQDITVGVRPRWADVRQPPRTLTLLFFIQLLLVATTAGRELIDCLEPQ